MKSFNDVYGEIYKEVSKTLDILKNKNRIKHVILLLVITIAFCFWKHSPIVCTLIICFAIALLVVSYIKQREQYVEFYKKNVINKIVKGYSENLEYYPNDTIG